MYINTHSCFSLRYGTMKVKELLKRAQEYGLQHLALTDINKTSACLDFLRMAPEYGIKPVVGVDFRNGVDQQFILLAKSNKGFQAINTYLTQLLHQEKFVVPDRAPCLTDVYVVYPYRKYCNSTVLAENEYVGIAFGELNLLHGCVEELQHQKLIVQQTVSFQNKAGFNTHRLLRAIDNNTLLSKLSTEEEGDEGQQFLPLKTLIDRFEQMPHLIVNTLVLLNNCDVVFDFTKSTSKNQQAYTVSESLDFRLLRKLAYDGVRYRYANPNDVIYNRIEQELELVKQKGFVSYFLINWKILKYAQSKGYYYVGRGSGANSIIAYLLRITDVDPIELDLYFERFINLYRKNPPDFDIDFSWADRDDVIDYVFKQFPNTALVTVYNTFQYKASVRELGKVMGLPDHEVNILVKGNYDLKGLDQLSQLVVRYAKRIEGLPNYLGIHAGGILISETPLQHYCATFLPPKGLPTVHFDMVVAEDIGLYKFDILSQRGLGKIKDAIALVEENKGEKVDIHDFQRFKKDDRIKRLLRNAKAIGCFYVESPAMRMLLKKLQVDHYLGLVAASSIIRPGVAKSGMMREYILRFRDPKKRKEAHPVMLEIMPETFGVMVYQEDVIKVAHYFAGLTLGEADILRRGMSGKFQSRKEFSKVKDQFFQNCSKKGYTIRLTAEIWRQIESFGGYAFAKGHSASYAVESYQSLFLKAYYPLEYMVATINNSGGFYRPEIYIHEARMHGAVIHAPCLNKSTLLTGVDGKDIYLGFHVLKSVENITIKSLLLERSRRGEYKSLDDFLERVSIGIEQLVILIKVDAFRVFRKSKRQLLWEAHIKVNGISFDDQAPCLFYPEHVHYDLPSLETTITEDAFDQLEYIGFTLCSPFNLLKDYSKTSCRAKALQQEIGNIITIDGYLVTIKNTRTSSGNNMHFGTFLDVDGDFIDTVHFPPIAIKYPFSGPGIYQIKGKVMEEFDSISVEVMTMERIPMIEDPRYVA